MNIVKYNKVFSSKIISLWNDEVGFIFPITVEKYNQNINDNKYLNLDLSYVCIDENNNNIVGFILGKTYDNNPIMPKYYNTSWISLIYVSIKYRKQGIGSKLLEKFESSLPSNCEKILVGSDIDCFFPGIPNDFDNVGDVFFRNKGYNVNYYTHDLISSINNTNTNIINTFNTKYEYRYATKEDKEKVYDFFERCFYGRWYYECIEYFENGEIEEEYLIVLDRDKVIGFLRTNKNRISKISYNIMWRDRFNNLLGLGPLGVDKEYRNQGIATNLLLKALEIAKKEGFSNCLIDWTGLLEYYQKFGFETWKCYQYANKQVEK